MKKSRQLKSRELVSRTPRSVAPTAGRLLADVRELIEAARQHVARAVNSTLVALCWHVGRRIRQDILGQRRAEYGRQIVATLSRQLTSEYGRGYSEPNLSRMMRLAEAFPDEEILSTLSKELSWSHFVEILALDDPLQRDFYAEMCRIERWSVRVLRQKIDRMLYERTAISKKPDVVIRRDLETLREKDRLTPDLVFRDPYFLDFLGLTGGYNERDMEQAILRELEAFLLELGSDFAFVARQKRISVDHEDYYLDLLFYHRRLRRLVAIDLKLGRFQAADKGQMELYLRWLQEHETRPDEEPPIGLILCAGKSAEHVRLLRLEAAGIRVAQYLTELPPQEVLERKLRDAIRLAREQLARRAELPAVMPRLSPPSRTRKKRAKKPKR
jgi:predicted nuclease of restriction endonuclease-like (RecB) superfamily